MKIIILISVLLFSMQLRASHIVGGDIYYDYLGNNQYKFYITMYRDCNSSGAQFDNPLHLAVYTSTNQLVQDVQVPFPGSQNLPILFNNPCATPPNNICVEKAVYTTTITLPPTPGGYTITYQRCCRGPNITNIVASDDAGFTLTCKIPGLETNAWENSSPRYNNYPPLLLCNTDDLNFDHSATDPDGDVLVYSLVTPYTGGSSFNPQPIPAPPPNYNYVQYAGGFNPLAPMGAGSITDLDPNTGNFFVQPQMLGLFVVAVRVQEYRNGVLLNETIRDFLFKVFDCNITLQAILPTQDQMAGFNGFCDGLTVNFENNSYGGSTYQWDFGVPGTNTDVSTAFEPSFTYPSDGEYTAMLVVNPGEACTDTSYIDIVVANPIEANFTSNDSICFINNSFDFIAVGNYPPGTIYSWDFGPSADPSTVTGESQVNGVNFSTDGTIPITFSIDYLECNSEEIGSIYIFPEPIAEIGLPDNIECDGLTIDFGNNSQNSNIFEWDFGGNSTSNLELPTHTFPGPGEYEIELIAGSGGVCMDTTSETINLYEELVVSFTTIDSTCFTDNSVDFDGTTSGPQGSVFTWNFGANASIPSSNQEDVNGVNFNATGDIPITLTGTFLNCVVSDQQSIYIYQEPSIDFILQPGLQCVPFDAYFIDQSFAETGIQYFWDFGDGQTSNEQNPIHTYTEVGNFPVTLTIQTAAGCIDTLIDYRADIVNVNPNPVAGFSVNPDYTDICNSAIQFNDESIGATIYSYSYGDGIYSEGVSDPLYVYRTDGTHYPIQYVENEFGCTDSTFNSLYIEPFPLYIPNTFTPDGDEFNNSFEPRTHLEMFDWNMKIYNRWGEMIFETNDFNIGWDGVGKNGRLVQDGIYLYDIEYVTCEPYAMPERITGHVNVLR